MVKEQGGKSSSWARIARWRRGTEQHGQSSSRISHRERGWNYRGGVLFLVDLGERQPGRCYRSAPGGGRRRTGWTSDGTTCRARPGGERRRGGWALSGRSRRRVLWLQRRRSPWNWRTPHGRRRGHGHAASADRIGDDYHEFLRIVDDFRNHRVRSAKVASRVKALFQDSPGLLLGSCRSLESMISQLVSPGT